MPKPGLWTGLFALGACLNILLGWHGWSGVLHGSLNDPDSYMRLVRLRQGIAAGHLVNIVKRDDGGAGVLVEWSRLLDILLWICAAPLQPFLGWSRALFVAGVASGPLAVGALGIALAFAARPLAEDRLLWSAPVAAALLPGLLSFAAPGVVHYHILLLALIAACAGSGLRAARGVVGGASWSGFFTGLFGGLAIWMTPETMPFILAVFGALLLRWAEPPWQALGRQARLAPILVVAGAGFIDMLAFGFAFDPPQGGYLKVEIDRLSIVYVLLGIGVLAAAQALSRLPRWNLGQYERLVGLGIAAGVILLWVAVFPQVAEGPYGLMSADDRRRFFGVMLETRPLHGAPDMVAFLLPGVLAFGYALWRAARPDRFWPDQFGPHQYGPDQKPAWWAGWPWAYLALVTLISVALADRFLLFTEFPAGIAAALLPVALSEAGQRWRARPAAAMAARLAVLAAVLLLPELPALAGSKPAASPHAASCSLRHIDQLLGRDKGVIVLAEVQDTPELLYRTPVETVGSLYQHGVAAYLASRAAWRSPPGATEPAAVAATGARLVLFCPKSSRYAPVQDLPPTTLWDALNAGTPPPWLFPRNADPASGWVVYEIH
jgi:hypothetical protein